MSAEEIIKATILGEEHLGENLKRICIEYLGSLKQENQKLKAYYGNKAQVERDLLLEENQELKEQLEDMTLCRDIASGHRKEVQDRETILLNQQKEFIEWLENKMNETHYTMFEFQAYRLAFEKYKEIIGGDK